MAEKELIVVAVPNGAGKTTFALEFLVERPMPYLSADAIAAELSPDDPTSARIDAGREFLTRLEERISADESVLVESTLSGRSFRNVLRTAKQAGFATTILFVFLDSADIHVARVRHRVRHGGHDVPESDVRRRCVRSVANFWSVYRQIADTWSLIYNSSEKFEDVATGDCSALFIQDEALYRRFLKLAEGHRNAEY